MSEYRTKIKTGRGKSKDGYLWRDEDFEAEYPTLFDFLSRVTDESGRSVEPGSVKIFTSEGKLKVLVKAAHERAVAFLTPDGLMGIFDLLDHQLQEGELDWRDDKFSKNGQK